MKNTLILKFLGLIGTWAFIAPTANAQYASEGTQLANNVLLTLQETYQRATEGYTEVIKDLQETQAKVLGAEAWGDSLSDLQNYANAGSVANGLSVFDKNASSNFASSFQNLGEIRQKNLSPAERNNIAAQNDLQLQNANRGAVGVASEAVGNFDSEQQTLANLRSQSQGAEGQMQAIQAGNQINSELIAQNQKTQALLAAQIQQAAAEAEAARVKNALEQADIEKQKKAFEEIDTTNDGETLEEMAKKVVK